MPSVLITDHVHDYLISGLRQNGYAVMVQKSMTNDKLREVIHLYDGIIINSKIQATAELQSLGTKLKFIGRLGSGLEIIDLDAAASNGIAVLNTPAGNNNAVAEHAMGMLLSLFNKIQIANRDMRSGKWEREANRGLELSGKTLGIIGFGHTGSQLAQKLQNWNVNVLAYDKYKKDYADQMDWVSEVDLPTLQMNSDIISIHLPLTDETIDFVDDPFFSACAKPIYLINTARGKNIDLLALRQALNEKRVLGACLDVFPNEKPQNYSTAEQDLMDWYYEQDNVIMTPHVAGWTHESLYKIAKIMLEKILHLPKSI